MNLFVIETKGKLQPAAGETWTREHVSMLVERIMDSLVDGTPHGADIGANLETGDLDFYIEVEAATPEDALGDANRIISQAVHPAGIVEAPHWDDVHITRSVEVPA
jgi:hypothetical protein